MLYTIENGNIRKIDREEFVKYKENPILCYMKTEHLKNLSDVFDISPDIIEQCEVIDTNFRSAFKIEDGMIYGDLTVVDALHLESNRGQIALFLRKNRIFISPILQEKNEIEKIIKRAVKRFDSRVTLLKLLYAILDELISGGNESLENMEKQMVDMEHTIIDNRVSESMNKDIFYMKKKLLVLKNYYEQMIELGELLKEWGKDLFGDEKTEYFYPLIEKMKRLSANTQNAKEGLIHLREALDANLEYNLNRIMKVFTVVTTIFAPLTLITGWYGMNFSNMPELEWKYGYVMVLGLSIAVVLACILFFIKKKLL